MLGNNYTTKISKKVILGNKKMKNNLLKVKKMRTKEKIGKVVYFPMQNFEKIYPSTSLLVISPVISPKW